MMLPARESLVANALYRHAQKCGPKCKQHKGGKGKKAKNTWEKYKTEGKPEAKENKAGTQRTEKEPEEKNKNQRVMEKQA